MGAMCPNMPRFEPSASRGSGLSAIDSRVHPEDSGHGRGEIAGDTSGVQVGGLHGPFSNEDAGIGSDVEIDWDWWGSSRSNSVRITPHSRIDQVYS